MFDRFGLDRARQMPTMKSLAVIFGLALISIAFEIYSDAALTSAEVSHTSVLDPATAAIAHARVRSPMCDRVASPLLGRGAGGCSPGYH
jgi:hypothetical protein